MPPSLQNLINKLICNAKPPIRFALTLRKPMPLLNGLWMKLLMAWWFVIRFLTENQELLVFTTEARKLQV